MSPSTVTPPSNPYTIGPSISSETDLYLDPSSVPPDNTVNIPYDEPTFKPSSVPSSTLSALNQNASIFTPFLPQFFSELKTITSPIENLLKNILLTLDTKDSTKVPNSVSPTSSSIPSKIPSDFKKYHQIYLSKLTSMDDTLREIHILQQNKIIPTKEPTQSPKRRRSPSRKSNSPSRKTSSPSQSPSRKKYTGYSKLQPNNNRINPTNTITPPSSPTNSSTSSSSSTNKPSSTPYKIPFKNPSSPLFINQSSTMSSASLRNTDLPITQPILPSLIPKKISTYDPTMNMSSSQLKKDMHRLLLEINMMDEDTTYNMSPSQLKKDMDRLLFEINDMEITNESNSPTFSSTSIKSDVTSNPLSPTSVVEHPTKEVESTSETESNTEPASLEPPDSPQLSPTLIKTPANWFCNYCDKEFHDYNKPVDHNLLVCPKNPNHVESLQEGNNFILLDTIALQETLYIQDSPIKTTDTLGVWTCNFCPQKFGYYDKAILQENINHLSPNQETSSLKQSPPIIPPTSLSVCIDQSNTTNNTSSDFNTKLTSSKTTIRYNKCSYDSDSDDCDYHHSRTINSSQHQDITPFINSTIVSHDDNITYYINDDCASDINNNHNECFDTDNDYHDDNKDDNYEVLDFEEITNDIIDQACYETLEIIHDDIEEVADLHFNATYDECHDHFRDSSLRH